MTKVQQDFEMWSGDHKNLVFGITGSDSSIAASLTGASGVWVLANDARSASFIRLTSDDSIFLSGSIATVSLSPAHTASLSGIYYHELQIRDAIASAIATVAVGTATINPDVATSN